MRHYTINDVRSGAFAEMIFRWVENPHPFEITQEAVDEYVNNCTPFQFHVLMSTVKQMMNGSFREMTRGMFILDASCSAKILATIVIHNAMVTA